MNPDESQLVDSDVRLRALSEFERPVLVEAGAGTGKTALLAGRILTWSLGTGWERISARTSPESPDPAVVARTVLGRVLAVTFTDAAAAEMASRIQGTLEELSRERPLPPWLTGAALPDPAVLLERSRHLLAAFGWLRIRTFHGWSLDLLREHGLRLGWSLPLEVDADGEATRRIVDSIVATEWPQAMQQDRTGDLLKLLLAGWAPGALSNVLQELRALGLPPQVLEREVLPVPETEAWVDQARAAIGHLATRLADVKFHANDKTGPRSRALLDGLQGAFDRQEPLRARWISARQQVRERTSKGPWSEVFLAWSQPGDSPKALAELRRQSDFTQACAELSRFLTALEAVDPDLLEPLFRLLASLARKVDEELRSRGIVGFGDQLRWARTLLDDQEILRQVQMGLDQVLVDELQDTDETQLEMLERLWLHGPPDLRPGAFGVGDPKQSIYGWRRARLPAYERFRTRLLGTSPPLQLAANFRSEEGILEEVARAVGPLMPARSEVMAPFVPLQATGSRKAQPGRIEYWVHPTAGSDSGPSRAGDRRQIEAESLADDLQRNWSGLGSAAVLFRSTTALDVYLETFRRRGIPYKVERDRNYFRRREVLDALSLLRAILEPFDTLSLAAALRSPAVGLPDAVLHAVWSAGLPQVLQDASGPDEATMHKLWQVLAEARQGLETTPAAVPGSPGAWSELLLERLNDLLELRSSFLRLPAGPWLDTVRERFPIELVAAGRYLAPYRLANLERFFREAEEWLLEDPSPVRFLARLERLAQERPDRAEAAVSVPPEQESGYVRVLTLHLAKGLEFDTVYLADLGSRPGRNRAQPGIFSAEFLGDRWELQLGALGTTGIGTALELRRRIERAERDRLLYVGLTRARRRLVLCGLLEEKPPDEALAGRLHHRWLSAGIDVDSWRRTGSAVDSHGVTWRALRPASSAAGRVVATPSRPAASAVTAAEAKAGLDRWLSESRAAQERMERPRFLPMTAELPGNGHERDPEESSPSERSRSRARAEGIALHLACELAELFGHDQDAWRSQVREAFSRALARGEAPEAAWRDFEPRLHRLLASRLWQRLLELQPAVLARELPVGLRNASGDPLNAYLGTVDLVLADPDGRLRIIDFKSESVPQGAPMEAILDRHRPQLERYARALKEALSLSDLPRGELWYLELDRALEVPPQD